MSKRIGEAEADGSNGNGVPDKGGWNNQLPVLFFNFP